MREYSSPLTVEIPATGNLTDDVVAQRRARRPTRWSSAAPTRRRRGSDVTAAEFLDEVRGGRQGPGRRRHRGRRPGRPDLQDPLRVDAGRLRDLVRRRGDRAGLRDLVGRADRVDPAATPGPRAVVAEGPEHTARIAERRADARPSSTTSGRSTDNAVEVLSRLGEDISDDDARGAAYDGDAARPGHAHLHLRHDRPAQGLHAHPRQLHVRARRRGARAARAVRGRRRLDPAVPAAGPRVRPDHPGRLRSRPGSGWATAPTSSTCSPTSASSSRRSSSPCPGSSRRSSTPPRSGPPPRAAAGIFDRAAETAIAYSRGARARQGRRSPSAPSTPLFSRLVYGRLRAALGGRCRYAVSGGAPLGDRLGHFYRGIGLTVLEGYGLTETTAALTVNRPDALKIGTVGRPLPGTEVRVAEDGELLFRGRPGLRRLLAATRRPPPRCSSATAGSTPATSARSTTRASSGSPAARRRSW